MLQVKTWVKLQVASDVTVYAYILEPFKSKGFRAVAFHSFDGSMSGHAKFESTSNWVGQPTVITRDDIPERILRKLDSKLAQTRFM